MVVLYFEKIKKIIFSKQKCRVPYQRGLLSVEAGGIYALKTRSCVTEIRKKTFGIRKTARRFSACLAVCMAAAYFEKMKKIHFLETELPHTVSEKTCSQLKPTGITPRRPVPAYPQKPGSQQPEVLALIMSSSRLLFLL